MDYGETFGILFEEHLRTLHLHAANFVFFCEGLTQDSARETKLPLEGVTVENHFLVKYGWQLKFPNLPCAIEIEDSGHVNYYPLEVISFS